MVCNSESTVHYALCYHCDLLSELPAITNHYKAICPRCHTRLARGSLNMKRDTIIYSVCALTMLLLACCFIFINIRVVGNTNNLNLLNISNILYQDNYVSLVLVFVLFVLVSPVLLLIIQIIVCSELPLSKFRKRDLMILYDKLQHWTMSEIFMAGVLVSFVKLTNYGDIGINQAFWAFCLFIIWQLKSTITFSTRQIWDEIASNNFVKTPLVAGRIGIRQNIRLCLCCHAILPAEQAHCPRCKRKGKLRERDKLQWTIALLITSFLLYIPANLFGIMNTLFLGSTSSSTIIDGVIYMWQEGDYPVALVIFTASIIIPVLKIIALTWLCYFVLVIRRKTRNECMKMSRLYKMVEFIGRWSMIDIFVVAVISALIRNGELISVYPDIGAVFFAAVVVITMIASHLYDSRLIWDRHKG
ncbi:PqiA/YebS family transporter subunit [Frischella perrara]|uniref:Paraquat-inducible membrane protein A n=1 Tax=Frischella perrara TaxID=1267021 RepID=A0A318N7R2_FRIPE|nr:PqiA/YebS family transporter subunit [Frischella perrara]PXY94928.1 paraquat-inducible membrane protein A [Frischella perrara]